MNKHFIKTIKISHREDTREKYRLTATVYMAKHGIFSQSRCKACDVSRDVMDL